MLVQVTLQHQQDIKSGLLSLVCHREHALLLAAQQTFTIKQRSTCKPSTEAGSKSHNVLLVTTIIISGLLNKHICFVIKKYCIRLLYKVPFTSKKKKEKSLKVALLLLHVNKRMTNTNTVQCLADLPGLAHVSGIFVQTCGCFLGESMSHGFLQTGMPRCAQEACAQPRSPSCPNLIWYFPLM